MSKDYKVYLEDIIDSIKKIEKFTMGLAYKSFSRNQMVFDAAVRNLEIIGEAVKNIPLETKKKYHWVDWRKIAGFRDILIHSYCGINKEIVWDVVSNKIPELKKHIKNILKNDQV